ncbi:MAG TPA: hypothetical protein DCS07_05750, partial [Bdellovibrionales bacterium]|nr:hypothetical protein [Bdellovibrionales bacterium]
VIPARPAQARIVSDTGQVLDFETNFLIGLRALVRSNGLLLECLRRSGMLASEEGHLIRRDDTFPQILTRETRLNLPLADDDLRIECEREFGKELFQKIGLVEALKEAEPEYLRYWFHLPDRLSLSEKKKPNRAPVPLALESLRKKLAKNRDISAPVRKTWFGSDQDSNSLARTLEFRDFENVLRAVWFSASGHINERPKLAEIFHLLVLGRGGAAFKGGISAYRAFLVQLARKSGAQIVEQAECRRIFVENGRFLGVQISNYPNMITGTGAVLGCSLAEAKERLSASGRKLFRTLKKTLKPDGWRFTIALSVHHEAIAPGITARMVWQEDAAPPIEIEIANPADYGLREPENKVIFLRTVLPYKEETLSASYQRLIATRMFRQLKDLVPFVEYHVARVYPDFREGDWYAGLLKQKTAQADMLPDDFSIYAFKSLEAIPFNLLCYSKEGVGSQSGLEGLFVATDESNPKFGTLGPTIAAVEAIAWLAHRSGLTGPFVVPSSSLPSP